MNANRLTDPVILALTWILGVASAGVCQERPVAPGERVRIELSDDGRVSGTLLSAGTDSLILLTSRIVASPQQPSLAPPEEQTVRSQFTRRSVVAVERSRGPDQMLGAVRGGLVGIGLAGALTAVTYLGGGDDAAFGAYVVAVWSFPIGAVLGGVVGSFVPVERWEPARLPE